MTTGFIKVRDTVINVSEIVGIVLKGNKITFTMTNGTIIDLEYSFKFKNKAEAQMFLDYILKAIVIATPTYIPIVE